MAKRKKFRIRKKPVEPVRQKNVQHYICRIEDSDTLSGLIYAAKENGFKPEDVTVNVEWGYEGIDSITLYGIGYESEELFNKRIGFYERELELYNKWYEENKHEIEKELQLRQEELKESAKKAEIVREARRKKDIEKLEKQLKKLKDLQS